MESESKFVKYGFIVEIALHLRRLIVQESADKINPQTVFYLGYSEQHYSDETIQDLRQEQRSVFLKLAMHGLIYIKLTA